MACDDDHRARVRGFTLLELSIGIALLGIVGLAMSAVLATTTSLNDVTTETIEAAGAAERILEEMRSFPREEVFARYNATAADDPADGASPASAFDAGRLKPVAGDPDGRVGIIEFPGDGVELREDVIDPRLGMPRDLDGDGVVDGIDHAAKYDVLPVRVRVTFAGRHGDRTVTMVTTF
jgi:prepilin-type N-terminal cleavage/methylation domain-containing protein